MATAEVFHVAANGNNTGVGTQESPWRTLQHAAGQVGPGDTVIVHAGTYAGFDLRRDGTAEQRITFQANPGVIINQQNPRTADGINLEGADYVTIQGFQIVGVPRAGIRSVTNHHVIIQDNVLDQNGTWGIFTAFSDDVLIQDNVATRTVRQHGIYVSNSGDRPVIRGNEIWGNYQAGIHMNGDRFAGGDGIISQALVERNLIYDNGRGGASAINADGVQNSRFANNRLYNNHASGISLYRLDGGGASSGNTVVNNTILQAADGRWGLNINTGGINNKLLNNVIYNAHLTRGSVSISPDSLHGLVSDFNVIMNRFSTDGGNTRITLAQWQAATGQDTRSIISTPEELFVNPAGGDVHLRVDSPAIDAGTPMLAPVDDFEGDARPQGSAVDIGADEFLVDIPRVQVLNQLGNVRLNVLAFHIDFPGDVHVATGDVTGDGTADMVVGAGPGGGPHVRVFDGVTGRRIPGPLGSFFAYDPNFTGGVFVAVADINGDRRADIITGPGSGGGPYVRVFNASNGSEMSNFFAFDRAFRGGVRVAAGDVTGDNQPNIITAAGPGGGPHVKTFHAMSRQQTAGPVGSFFAYEPGFRGGAFVAVADLNGDRRADIVTGPGSGGGPHVRTFNAGNGTELSSFFAFDRAFRGGVRVAAGDVTGDNQPNIITAAGPGGGPHVKTFHAMTGQQVAGRLGSFFAHEISFRGGLFVAATRTSLSPMLILGGSDLTTGVPVSRSRPELHDHAISDESNEKDRDRFDESNERDRDHFFADENLLGDLLMEMLE